uniref:Uncharacterized protein n=1 Tax=Fagus sylvatica TaxID=28930 RepID=A0A2N9FZD8_FAGSY
MRHIVGKLSTSSFQRYKVCANRSSDEGVMAPGSRGIGAVFVHSSGEDSDQTGDAFGEPRVPRRSRESFQRTPADQLVRRKTAPRRLPGKDRFAPFVRKRTSRAFRRYEFLKGTRTEIEEDSRGCWRGRIRLPRGSTTTRAGPSCAAHDGAARGVHGFL